MTDDGAVIVVDGGSGATFSLLRSCCFRLRCSSISVDLSLCMLSSSVHSEEEVAHDHSELKRLFIIFHRWELCA